jgi:hypothetical protein
MPESLKRRLGINVVPRCLYCSDSPDTTEHVLPAAFGYFKNAPMLQDRLCSNCNSKRLGLLDQQLARCGVEGFFRRYYGIVGRKHHDPVNPFVRGSAGAKRIEATTFDPVVGREVAIEISSDGQPSQLCALTIIEEESGKHYHIPLRPTMTADQLRDEFNRCTAIAPIKVAVACDSQEREWIEALMRKAWPTVEIPTETTLFSNVIERPLLKFQVTDRYHRAFAKLGFHYFLSQFSQFKGTEAMFDGIRQFILEDTDDLESSMSDFITLRELPLLSPAAMGFVPPDGWRAHVLAAEVRPDVCIAHVQMFVTCEWKSPIRTIILARSHHFTTHQAVGHLFLYHCDGTKDGFAGEATALSAMAV